MAMAARSFRGSEWLLATCDVGYRLHSVKKVVVHRLAWAMMLRPKCNMDTLGIEPRASRMLSGCDTTTPFAQLLAQQLCLLEIQAGRLIRRPVWEKMMHGR